MKAILSLLCALACVQAALGAVTEISASWREIPTDGALNLTGTYDTKDAHCVGADADSVFDTAYRALHNSNDWLRIDPFNPLFFSLIGGVTGTNVSLVSRLAICTGDVEGSDVKLVCIARDLTTCTAVFRCRSGPCTANAGGLALPSLAALAVGLVSLWW
eukprot:m51a1_g7715 hypothetical protein (160) ;mRNA; f:120470-121015